MMTFEEFLQDKHLEIEVAILDDDLPDAFNDWLTTLDVESWLDYGDQYAKQLQEQKVKINIVK